MLRSSILRTCLATIVMASGAVGCSSDRDVPLGDDATDGAPDGERAVSGTEREWDVAVDVDHVPAGTVTFTFENVGTIEHELLVVRTDIPVGALPVDPATGRFAEDSDRWGVIDEIPEFPAGDTRTLTVELPAGQYQLACNIPGHYASGMAAGFTVVAD